MGFLNVMSKEELKNNTFTKEARKSVDSRGQFGIGRFGRARFGKKDIIFDKEALSANSHTKEVLPSKIS